MITCRQCGEVFVTKEELARHLSQELICRNCEIAEMLVEQEMLLAKH